MSFVQQTRWEGSRRADVRVINITDRALAVRRIRLAWDGYPGASQSFPARVGAGQTLDLHYRLPAPDCTADPAARATGVVVTARRTITRTIDAMGMRFLSRIWAADCGRRRVDALLDLALVVPDPRRATRESGGGSGGGSAGAEESTLPIVLRLTRTPGARPTAVSVETVLGTVLFDLTLHRPGEGLARGQRRATARLSVDPGRCDEHARSQVSQPFTFRFGLRIGADPVPVSIVVEPDSAARNRLLRFLDAACAGVTSH